MAFWKHNIINQSHIDTLLDKPDVTLTEILGESDVLQEVRSHTPKLIKFICRPDILDELVALIISDPDPTVDYTQQYKLANTACEVLTFDVPGINDALIETPHLLTRVCGVFRQEDALNDLTASFVCKLLILLATKRTEKFLDFIQYYDPDRFAAPVRATLTNVNDVPTSEPNVRKETTEETGAEGDDAEKADDEKLVENRQQGREAITVQEKDKEGDVELTSSNLREPKHRDPSADFVDLLLNHINNSAIKDLINRLVECNDNPELRPQVIEWLASAQLVSKLVALLSPENSEQVVTNSAKCLCKIVKVGREQQMVLQDKCPDDPLLASVEETDTISDILKHALPNEGEELSSWTLYESNFIFLSLLQYKKTTPSFQDIGVDPQCFLSVYATPTDSSPTLGELDQQRAKESINKCLKALSPRLGSLVEHLSLEKTETFGSVRLEISKLVASIVSCGDEPSLIVLRDLRVLPSLIDLFFSYPLCSQLHNQLDTIVQAICTPPRTQKASETENAPNTEAVLVQKCAAQTESASPQKKHILFDQLFGESAILEKIVDNYSTVPKEQLGYNGHLRLMANYVETMAENAFREVYTELMEGLSPELKERWTAFKEKLQNVNKLYAKAVEPLNTTASCSEGDDPAELRDMGVPTPDAITSAQQSFNDYQLNQVTVNFFDQFGFQDDEFTDVDIPGMGKVASPPIDDHSSDEEDNEGLAGSTGSTAGGVGSNFDPWNKMDEGFNPWNLAGTSGGDDAAAASASQLDTDDWADFGSLKAELNVIATQQGGAHDNSIWANFDSFQHQQQQQQTVQQHLVASNSDTTSSNVENQRGQQQQATKKGRAAATSGETRTVSEGEDGESRSAKTTQAIEESVTVTDPGGPESDDEY
ncbi:serine/threonine-protein phosphatase 6 regulatory subunit 3-like [Tropilaelaps mercedesae]|uniref:Serine/threonine-protein phosphatase 6 regulatory subunit 3-like n=1 Tax=Tropilaelaps mercedesae TaxID=418985 RepID=A0A1V9XK23_9ACAR|nr:serine/threonine-protein phosphatase 6 regulatory subunit 3-like [Tropilaelaps mercedesae]